jgi:hypothetical protein
VPKDPTAFADEPASDGHPTGPLDGTMTVTGSNSATFRSPAGSVRPFVRSSTGYSC